MFTSGAVAGLVAAGSARDCGVRGHGNASGEERERRAAPTFSQPVVILCVITGLDGGSLHPFVVRCFRVFIL